MDYALTKELKDAGFPQPKPKELGYDHGYYLHRDNDIAVYHPTLSELIEACGEQFSMFEKAGLWKRLDCRRHQS
jgi:hypothetical protein